MSPLVYYGSSVLAALLLGSASAWWAVRCGRWGRIQLGPWRHYPAYGSSRANPYVRAQAMLEGPGVLRRSEVIYFIADHDDDGRPLQTARSYRIEGKDLDARWWSVTVYGGNHHLCDNRLNRYSFSSANIARNPDGTWTIRLSRAEQPGNWIPTGDGQRFEVFLRMYNPAATVLEDVGSVDLPRIVREDKANA
jgi:hypothetical protein